MQLVKTVNNIEIHLTPEGRFRATVNGDVITKPTIGAIEKVIKGAPKMPEPVRVMGIDRLGNPFEYTIIKTRSRGYSDALITDAGTEIPSYRTRCLKMFDETSYASALGIQVEYQEMKKRHNAEEQVLIDRLTEIRQAAAPFSVSMLRPSKE